ncbi:hypothetical protein MBM_03336 [Drepanopeziza brunnea f. sp. 'multigermtubi' MB_m1]|uniref:Uncharacterized protein n=1 Tax=Marssonina brunnea f. sp. multigermtubi (strain MB_m1) TaxID=1072389 RepID=K1XC47_MARBU|nr:uncharacterized protein MBM_03336 [Drepanopeziza brunnea f. sp. 'multigermtubi' MB_m1]EKD18343.1 hypothetical protein MBM_03336 [Drepanopeziza brunnea f. sp. 'multigermtubi' MB_m1]
MQSIDPRGKQRASGTSARAQATEIQAPRISTQFTNPLSRPAEPPSMLPNDPGTRNTFERPDGDAPDLDNYASDLDFDLDSLPYSKPESHTRARLIIEDFLDIKSEGLKDHELWSLFRHAKQVERFPNQSSLIRLTKIIDEALPSPLPLSANSLRQSLREEYEELRRQKEAIARDLNDLRNLTITRDAQKRKESIEEATRHKEELKAARQSSRRSSRDSLPSPVPLLLQPPIPSPREHAKEYDEPLKVEEIPGNFYSHQGNGYRQDRAQEYEQALASNPNDPDGSDGDPERGNKRGSEWNGHGGRGGGHGGPTKRGENGPPRDPGFGNEPPRDPGRGYEPPGGPGPNRPLTSTPFSTRVLARHTYGTPAPNDDDFPELGTADPYPRAKELALFARSFPKELKYSGPDDDFRTQLRIFANQASRYGLTSDDYLAAFPIMLTREAITFYYNHVIKARLPTFKANAIAVRDHFETDHRRQAKYDRWEQISLELVRKENPGTSLSECFEKLAKELRGIQSSLRPGLRDDRSLADKLYSACKNVPETTIARMNPAFTSTAAVADIRRAIGFATESIQPLKSESYRPSKANRAYASSSEPFDQSQHSSQHSLQHSSQHSSQHSPQHSSQTSSKADSDNLEDEYECFIQGCQYGGEHCEHFAR